MKGAIAGAGNLRAPVPGGAFTVGVLALQGDVVEHERVLARLGVSVSRVRTPSELDAVDALVLPGGESTTLGMLIDLAGLREPLHERLAAGMAAFGTCAGLILLSREVLDGRPDQSPLGAIDIVTRRNAFGRQLHSFEADLEITAIDGGPVHAVFIRAPVVEGVGRDVEVLASVEHAGVPYPVVCRQGSVVVASFHPELADETRLHRLFLEIAVGSSLSKDALESSSNIDV